MTEHREQEHREPVATDRRQAEGGDGNLPRVTTGHRYRRARELAGLSLARASRLLELRERASLGAIEHHPMRASGDLEHRMCCLYGCSPAWLSGGDVQLDRYEHEFLHTIEYPTDRARVAELLASLPVREK